MGIISIMACDAAEGGDCHCGECYFCDPGQDSTERKKERAAARRKERAAGKKRILEFLGGKYAAGKARRDRPRCLHGDEPNDPYFIRGKCYLCKYPICNVCATGSMVDCLPCYVDRALEKNFTTKRERERFVRSLPDSPLMWLYGRHIWDDIRMWKAKARKAGVE